MPWISLHGAAVTAQSLMGEVTLTPSPFDFRQLINLAHKDQRPDKGMNPAMHNCITSHVPDCPPWNPRTAAEPSTYYRTQTRTPATDDHDDDTEIKMALRRKHTPPKNQTPLLAQEGISCHNRGREIPP